MFLPSVPGDRVVVCDESMLSGFIAMKIDKCYSLRSLVWCAQLPWHRAVDVVVDDDFNPITL